jgi:3-hydroxybutyryl-CoA dehydrogenase
VVGAGTMGPGIAAVLSAAGVETSLWARRKEAADAAATDAESRVRLLESSGLADSAGAAIRPSADLGAALDGTGIVIEAISEDIEAKRALLAAVEAQVGEATILASTTSGLDPDAISRDLRHPERFVVAHFWNPAHLIPLVEVLGSSAATPSLVDVVCRWLETIGKHPVRLRKFVPGFLGVRLQQAVVREAVALLEDGVAAAEDIDAATRLSFGARFPIIGPLETSDLGGLDVVANIHEYLLADLDASSEPQQGLMSLVESGKLGVKSGEGFYDWSLRDAEDLIRRRDEELLMRMRMWRDSLGSARGA